MVRKTYMEWTMLLRAFAEGDDGVLEAMQQSTIELDAGNATRFVLKVEEAYHERKKLWLAKFQRSFRMQHVRTIDEYQIILQQAKTNLNTLAKFTQCPGFTNTLRTTLHGDLENFIEEIKKSLADNLPKTSGEREKLLLSIQAFRLTNFSPTSSPVSGEKLHTPLTPEKPENTNRKRRIIL